MNSSVIPSLTSGPPGNSETAYVGSCSTKGVTEAPPFAFTVVEARCVVLPGEARNLFVVEAPLFVLTEGNRLAAANRSHS